METFQYEPEAVQYLSRNDPVLGQAIERIGPIRRAVMPDLFPALVHSIVSQQISNKAAATIWGRMTTAFGEITPAVINELTAQAVQQFGMSMRKAGYIKSLAGAVSTGKLDLEALHNLPDEEVLARLSALPGIGTWTAEMILIFSMQRPDVVSWGDLGIRRGMVNLYRLDSLSRAQFEQYRRGYSPFGTVASLYLWHIAMERPAP